MGTILKRMKIIIEIHISKGELLHQSRYLIHNSRVIIKFPLNLWIKSFKKILLL